MRNDILLQFDENILRLRPNETHPLSVKRPFSVSTKPCEIGFGCGDDFKLASKYFLFQVQRPSDPLKSLFSDQASLSFNKLA